jgi:hypothetical protein
LADPETARISVPDGVLHQQLDDHIGLFNPATEQYYILDDVGSRIWELVQEHGTIGPVVAAVTAEYAIDGATARRDVDRLLRELSEAGLVQVESPRP